MDGLLEVVHVVADVVQRGHRRCLLGALVLGSSAAHARSRRAPRTTRSRRWEASPPQGFRVTGPSRLGCDRGHTIGPATAATARSNDVRVPGPEGRHHRRRHHRRRARPRPAPARRRRRARRPAQRARRRGPRHHAAGQRAQGVRLRRPLRPAQGARLRVQPPADEVARRPRHRRDADAADGRPGPARHDGRGPRRHRRPARGDARRGRRRRTPRHHADGHRGPRRLASPSPSPTAPSRPPTCSSAPTASGPRCAR